MPILQSFPKKGPKRKPKEATIEPTDTKAMKQVKSFPKKVAGEMEGAGPCPVAIILVK